MRLNAFTLVEVLVALLLLAIVGTLALFIMSNSKTAFRSFHKHTIERQNVLQTLSFLKRDFDSGSVTNWGAQYVTIVKKGNSFEYSNKGDSLERSDGVHPLMLPSALSNIDYSNSVLNLSLRKGDQQAYFQLSSYTDVSDRILKSRMDVD